MRIPTLAFALSLVLTSACANDGIGDGTDPAGDADAGTSDDTTTDTDAGNDPFKDTTEKCDIAATFGALGAKAGEAPIFDNALPLLFDVSEDGSTALALELWRRGRFTDAIATGSYELSAGGHNDCDACLVLLNEDSSTLLAQSGTLVIETVQLDTLPGRITGSIQNLDLKQSKYYGDGSLLEDGCETTIDSATFDFAVTAPPADGPM